MRQAVLTLALVAVCLTLASCGSSSTSTQTTTTPPPASTVPTSISIQDNPPSGVTILLFQIQLTAANLVPADASQPSVPLLNGPQNVELLHLQTEAALLANANVPAAQYNGLNVTFANPQMTIFNESNQTLTVGTQSCAPNQLCMLTPVLNQMAVNIQAPTAPFPLTLTAASPLALILHFDVNASVQGDLSVTPMVNVHQLQIPPNAVPQFRHITGLVTAVSSPGFTLQAGLGGNTYNITTDSNTKYRFGRSCSADNFTCIAVGQVLRVRVNQMSGGVLDATDVALLAPRGLPAFEGTIVSTNAAQNQIQVVLTDRQCQQPQFLQVPFGAPLTVQLAPSTTFTIDSDDITVPAGLSFASMTDLIVGQVVEFQPQLPLTISGTPPNIMVTVSASNLQLEPSQITASVSTVNGGASPPNFILNGLPPLFTGAGITIVQVDAVMGTEFDNVSGVGGLTTGQTVSVSGLLFNTPTQPTVIAEDVRLRMADN
jgi:uncharacterized protein DUF5666/uncharacterized protein DUF4382